MDKIRFLEALNSAAMTDSGKGGIGTLGEKSIHSVLKYYFEPYRDNHETAIGGYVADIIGENGIIEIQTRCFQRLREKLNAFLQVSRVTVVYPMINKRWLLWIDKESGELITKRRCSGKPKLHEAFIELYRIKEYLGNENFSFCIVLLDVEELRYKDGYGKNRNIRATKVDKIPVDIADELYFNTADDYRMFVPDGLPQEYTLAEFAKAAGINDKVAGITLRVLTELELVSRCGKRGNAILYRSFRDA